MYLLNSLNADIQLIVDGAWANRLTILFIAPVFRVSLPQKLNYHKNQAVAIPKVANMSDPR